MSESKFDMLEKLDPEDREKVSYFINLLIHQSKYRSLRQEIAARRAEVEKGEVFTHKEIWDIMDV